MKLLLNIKYYFLLRRTERICNAIHKAWSYQDFVSSGNLYLLNAALNIALLDIKRINERLNPEYFAQVEKLREEQLKAIQERKKA